MTATGSLDGIAKRDPWQDQALCSQVDAEIFFPNKGGSPREAKTICRGCPVQQQCLEYALKNNERHGIWGGLTDYERNRLNGGIPHPTRRETGRCVNDHRLERPGNCRQCTRDKSARYERRVRAGLTGGRRATS